MKYIVSVYSGLKEENSFSPYRLKTAFSLTNLDGISSKLEQVIEEGVLSPEEEEEDPTTFFFSILLIEEGGKVEPVKHFDVIDVKEYRFLAH